MKTLKLLVMGAALMTGLVACPRENIIFSTDARIVRGNWSGTAKRVCANVSQTAWSPDGTKIISNGKRTVIWDAVTGARVRVIAEESAQVVWTEKNIITASRLAYETNNYGIKVKFWNPSSGVLERSLNFNQADNYNPIQVSPDGTRAVLTSRNLDVTTVSVVSLTDGTKQRDLDVGPVPNGTSLRIWSPQWSADGSRIFARREVQNTVDYSVPPATFVRVWQADTGTVERNLSGVTTVASSPDGKTLAYSDATPGSKLLNLETGTVRTLPNGEGLGVTGWNPSATMLYLQGLGGGSIEIWDVGALKLEKTVTDSKLVSWDSSGAPADTGVTPYEQGSDSYSECSLKILDLTTLKPIRTLNESTLDSLEVKFALNATYFNENEYGISGTASIAGTELKVRGKGNAGTRGRLVAQTPADMGPASYLELLDAAGAAVWNVTGFANPYSSMQAGPAPAYSWEFGAFGGGDGYNLKLVQTP